MKVKVALLVIIVVFFILSRGVFFQATSKEGLVVEEQNSDIPQVEEGKVKKIPIKVFRAETSLPSRSEIQSNPLNSKVSSFQSSKVLPETDNGTIDEIGGYYDEFAMSPESKSTQVNKISSIGEEVTPGLPIGSEPKKREKDMGPIGTAVSESNASPEIDN